MTLIHQRCPNCDIEGKKPDDESGYSVDEYDCLNRDCRVRRFTEYYG